MRVQLIKLLSIIVSWHEIEHPKQPPTMHVEPLIIHFRSKQSNRDCSCLCEAIHYENYDGAAEVDNALWRRLLFVNPNSRIYVFSPEYYALD